MGAPSRSSRSAPSSWSTRSCTPRCAAGRLAPFAIGMTVTVCILMFGVLTGGSVNPARTIGPAVATGVYNGIAVYLVAQLFGGALAGLLYRVFWVPQSAVTRL